MSPADAVTTLRARLRPLTMQDCWLIRRACKRYVPSWPTVKRFRASGQTLVLDARRPTRQTTHRRLAAGGFERGLMAVLGWTRPDMLLGIPKTQAATTAAAGASSLDRGKL